MTSQVWAVKVTAAIDSAGTLKTFYCSSEKLVTGASDTPAHTAFMARVIRPGTWSVSLFEPRSTGGAATASLGEVVLANADGRLDGWIEYGWAGRPIVVRVGVRGAAYPSGFGVVLRGTVANVFVEGDEVRVVIADRLAGLDVPAVAAQYTGGNVLPAGIEGVDDLAGQTKPWAWGVTRNVPVVCVNTSRLIYQASAGALTAVDGVFDRGVGLTAGATYASQADMEATAPAAGQYRAWLGGGCVRLGATPSGSVTADVVAGAAVRAGALLAGLAALAGQSVSSADAAALDAAAPYALGLFVAAGEAATVRELMDRVAASVGGWYAHDRSGVIRCGRLSSPGGVSAVAAVEPWQVQSLKRVTTRNGNGSGVAWRVAVAYRRCWSVQDDLAAGAGDVRRAFAGRDVRRAVASNATIKTQHLLADDLQFGTLIDLGSDAQTEAARLLSLYQVQRDCFVCDLGDFDDLLKIVSIGDVISLRVGRYGLSSGKNFVVLGVSVDRYEGICALTLWG